MNSFNAKITALTPYGLDPNVSEPLCILVIQPCPTLPGTLYNLVRANVTLVHFGAVDRLLIGNRPIAAAFF